MEREPLVSAAGVVAAVSAVLALVVAFGLELTEEQQEAVLGVAMVVAPLLVAALARPKVTPVADPRLGPGTPVGPAGV